MDGRVLLGTPEWRLFLLDGGTPVSHLKIVTRRGTAAGDPVRLGGIGSVMTPTPFRGRGYASELLRRAGSFMFDDLGVELGLLFCLRGLVPFYRSLGWIEVESPVWIEQPAGRVPWPESAMALPRPGVPWRDGEVDVCGIPW
ncbi:MAG TPA: GNAT family N-acetyltransferase [Longimicrobium sp.]|nr:GNAT family N-acetyltransferase [Longimicrobium sp.]